MRGAKTVRRTHSVIGAVAAMLLVSCDGVDVAGIQGSGGPSPMPAAAAPVAVGPITGFGSVFVNGVEYITSNAQILIDHQAGAEAQLHPGQIVTVKGNVNADGVTGTATEVSF